jgi:hypothetical protein
MARGKIENTLGCSGRPATVGFQTHQCQGGRALFKGPASAPRSLLPRWATMGASSSRFRSTGAARIRADQATFTLVPSLTGWRSLFFGVCVLYYMLFAARARGKLLDLVAQYALNRFAPGYSVHIGAPRGAARHAVCPAR